MRNEAGFTVVEALVALVILAFASVTLLRAAETHIRRIDALETRAAAQWVAENRLAEITTAPGDAAELPDEVTMLGRNWRIEQRFGATEDPDLASIELLVSEAAGASPVASLPGFIDAGTPQ